ncbi:T9SS type A sorting domain-containing protein [Fibrella sp. WM1]|uniref:T9SS type A sorting domain-containing protein n=1 Tax=Fibrella musci TaxID=3242485 RepID=UPI003520E589
MKQTLQIYGCLLGLLVATSLRAQDPGRSRLNLGRKAPANSPTATTSVSKPQRLLVPRPYVMAPMDRLLTLGKNSAIRDYYRSILIAPSAQATRITSSTRAAAAETPATPVIDRNLSENTLHSEERMYASDQLTVSNIYPNPANDFADIDYAMSNSVGSASITLLNILGSPIAEYTLDRNERKVRLQTRDLPSGYYFYQLSVEGTKVATKKLLVKHQ